MQIKYEKKLWIKHIIIFCIILSLSNAMAACNFNQQPSAEPTLSPGEHEIDPTFRTFYPHYGGEEVFGPAISDARFEGDVIVQFTVAAKLIFDPNEPPQERFSLAPLGNSLIVPEPEVPEPKDASLIYVNGHVIHPVFAESYQKLRNILGKPLTEGRFNEEYRHIEQLFENMGLIYEPGSGTVRSMAYGVAMCDSRCRETVVQDNLIFHFYPVDPTFTPVINALGIDFTGYPLTPGYNTETGRWQQIFENLVLSTQAPNLTDTLIVEPIGDIVPFVKDPAAVDPGDPEMQFLAVQGELGYAIPFYFWNYYLAHKGEAIIGEPISQLRLVKGDTVYVQCFTNLCLQYDTSEIESLRIQPYSLGYPYKTMYGPETNNSRPSAGDFPQPSVTPTPTQSPQPTSTQPLQPSPTPTSILTTITMKTWTSSRTLDTRLRQEIGVSVALNRAPMSGVLPFLTLFMPDNSQVGYQMPLTNVDGISVIHLPLIQGDNGDVIIYDVCIQRLSGELFCIEDDFVIWSNP